MSKFRAPAQDRDPMTAAKARAEFDEVDNVTPPTLTESMLRNQAYWDARERQELARVAAYVKEHGRPPS